MISIFRNCLLLLNVHLSVPCDLGFTKVCNIDQTTTAATAICPAGVKEVRRTDKSKSLSFTVGRSCNFCIVFACQEVDTETECSCLPQRQVEDDLRNGVNPLGLVSQQCYQVSSDIALLYNKNGGTFSYLFIFRYTKTPQ